MSSDPNASGNWFQRLIARLTGRGAPSPTSTVGRYGAMSQPKSAEEMNAARAQAREAMQSFREDHVRTQGVMREEETRSSG